MSRQLKKTLETEQKTFYWIGGHLYQKGKGKNLKLCICEEEYVSILQSMHAK